MKQLTLSLPKCTKNCLPSGTSLSLPSPGFTELLETKDPVFCLTSPSIFSVIIFFFSVGKVIWNHDSSKQCPTFDYGILKWKKNISCWHQDAYPGWLTAPGKKSNLIGLNFEVTKSLHTTRIFLSFCNGNHTLIGTKTFRGSGWLEELIWLLFHWRVRQQQVQQKSNLRDL